MVLGRILTKEERLELVKERYKQPDFQPDFGGFTSVGVDVARRFHNERFEDKLSTLYITDPKLIRKLAQKNIPLVTSVRMNKEYIQDAQD
jgi:hypothetical protein